MNDKELLELAAKANWRQELADDEVMFRYSERDNGMLYIHADNQDHNGLDREFVWNPLQDDGDALRLAVKLKIDTKHYDGYVVCWFESFLGTGNIPYGDDPYAATRRAITRAAAEIGRVS